MDEIKIGSDIPPFTVPDQNGNSFNINPGANKKNLLIYFYQKDICPGGTKEARLFQLVPAFTLKDQNGNDFDISSLPDRKKLSKFIQLL
jgi:hypothetical protein